MKMGLPWTMRSRPVTASRLGTLTAGNGIREVTSAMTTAKLPTPQYTHRVIMRQASLVIPTAVDTSRRRCPYNVIKPP